jgi:hypothetical protein
MDQKQTNQRETKKEKLLGFFKKIGKIKFKQVKPFILPLSSVLCILLACLTVFTYFNIENKALNSLEPIEVKQSYQSTVLESKLPFTSKITSENGEKTTTLNSIKKGGLNTLELGLLKGKHLINSRTISYGPFDKMILSKKESILKIEDNQLQTIVFSNTLKPTLDLNTLEKKQGLALFNFELELDSYTQDNQANLKISFDGQKTYKLYQQEEQAKKIQEDFEKEQEKKAEDDRSSELEIREQPVCIKKYQNSFLNCTLRLEDKPLKGVLLIIEKEKTVIKQNLELQEPLLTRCKNTRTEAELYMDCNFNKQLTKIEAVGVKTLKSVNLDKSKEAKNIEPFEISNLNKITTKNENIRFIYDLSTTKQDEKSEYIINLEFGNDTKFTHKQSLYRYVEPIKLYNETKKEFEELSEQNLEIKGSTNTFKFNKAVDIQATSKFENLNCKAGYQGVDIVIKTTVHGLLNKEDSEINQKCTKSITLKDGQTPTNTLNISELKPSDSSDLDDKIKTKTYEVKTFKK